MSDKMRSEFEAWVKPKIGDECRQLYLWDAWQAALAQQASEPAQVSQPTRELFAEMLKKLPRYAVYAASNGSRISENYTAVDLEIDGGWVRFKDIEKLMQDLDGSKIKTICGQCSITESGKHFCQQMRCGDEKICPDCNPKRMLPKPEVSPFSYAERDAWDVPEHAKVTKPEVSQPVRASPVFYADKTTVNGFMIDPYSRQSVIGMRIGEYVNETDVALYLAPPDYEQLKLRVAELEKPVSPSLNSIDNVEAEDGIRYLIANHKETEGDAIGTLIFKLKDESISLRKTIFELEKKCEINRLNSHNFEIECKANFLTATCFKVERDALKLRVAEYKASAEQDAKVMTKLHHDKERLRGILYEAETERDNLISICDRLKRNCVAIESLLSDDKYASGFQSLAQYRSQILKTLEWTK